MELAGPHCSAFTSLSYRRFLFLVTYLNSGPFSSFAPYYDSTWATLNKEESDLLLATFGGDEHCVRYVDRYARLVWVGKNGLWAPGLTGFPSLQIVYVLSFSVFDRSCTGLRII